MYHFIQVQKNITEGLSGVFLFSEIHLNNIGEGGGMGVCVLNPPLMKFRN